jgi:transcriptional regulator with XRE-family HTH domain
MVKKKGKKSTEKVSEVVQDSASVLEDSATVGDRAEAISRHLGERVNQLRTARQWSLDRLATASGVSKSMLSQIERQQTNPTLAVTLRIAQAFGMSLADLVESPAISSAIQVIRAEDRTYHYRSDRLVRIRTLSPLNLEKDVEFYEVQLEPRGVLRSSGHFQGTREFLTVERGTVRIESGRDTETLQLGDSANYQADIEHALVNVGKEEAVVFLVVIYK